MASLRVDYAPRRMRQGRGDASLLAPIFGTFQHRKVRSGTKPVANKQLSLLIVTCVLGAGSTRSVWPGGYSIGRARLPTKDERSRAMSAYTRRPVQSAGGGARMYSAQRHSLA